MKKMYMFVLAAMVLASLMGCATLGRNFPDSFASKIVIGKTVRGEIEKKLGSPFRTGLDSGNPTATYLYYHMGLFTDAVTKDLTVTYTPQDIVKAYMFNSNSIPGSEKEDVDYTTH